MSVRWLASTWLTDGMNETAARIPCATQNVASYKKESKIPFHRCTEVRRSGFLSCLPQDYV